jgi:hypothetical protein
MDIVLECPHCKIFFIMNENELNCKIIRHAVFKKNMCQINPHLPKNECDDLVEKKLVIGCAKPSQIIIKKDKYIAIECDYI